MTAPDDVEPSILDVNLEVVPSDLKQFLLEPQTGARDIAKHFFRQASEMRQTHFAAMTAQLAPTTDGTVFAEVPRDEGHFGLPYFDHLLRGLRRSLPDEVRSVVLDRETVDVHSFDDIAGIVVAHV